MADVKVKQARANGVANQRGNQFKDVGRPHEGHGRRLSSAFEALNTFPALEESRSRIVHLVSKGASDLGDVVSTVESDVALAIATMRLANRNSEEEVSTIIDAVNLLTPEGVESLASSISIYNFFENSPKWNGQLERFRLHSVATKRAAVRIASEIDFGGSDELIVTALLHDIGKLVLEVAYPPYPIGVIDSEQTPEQRVDAERCELGFDHTMAGRVITRRWGLPESIASAIECHHSDTCEDAAAILRVADMLAHYEHEQPIDPKKLRKFARRIGLKKKQLQSVIYEISLGGLNNNRSVERCPLTEREIQVLRRLAQGKVYKQISTDLCISTSTTRTHLHNIYGKIGALDRAQAVLIASKRGWL